MIFKSLIAASAALFCMSPASASILELSYTFNDGRSVFASMYGSLTSGNIFDVTGSRYYQQGNKGQYQGTTSIRGIYSPVAQIALDKSLVNFKAQFTPSIYLNDSVLLSVGDGIGPSQPPLASYSDTRLEPLDVSRLTVTLLQDATLDFSYFDTRTALTVTGAIAGWVTPDGSRFEVGSLTSIDGVAVPAGLITSGNYGQAPSIMLDKSRIDAAFYSVPGNKYRGDNLLMNRGGTYADIEFPDGLFATTLDASGTPIFGNLVTSNLTFHIDGVTTAVPEPASWAMMIMGVGAVGGAMRRRKVALTIA